MTIKHLQRLSRRIGLQSDRDVVTIEDEIVDFEDWMVGGTTIKGGRVVPVGIHITITSESGSDIENHPLLLEHPEIFEQEWDDRDDDLLLGVDDIGDTLLPGYLELMDDILSIFYVDVTHLKPMEKVAYKNTMSKDFARV